MVTMMMIMEQAIMLMVAMMMIKFLSHDIAIWKTITLQDMAADEDDMHQFAQLSARSRHLAGVVCHVARAKRARARQPRQARGEKQQKKNLLLTDDNEVTSCNQ